MIKTGDRVIDKSLVNRGLGTVLGCKSSIRVWVEWDNPNSPISKTEVPISLRYMDMVEKIEEEEIKVSPIRVQTQFTETKAHTFSRQILVTDSSVIESISYNPPKFETMTTDVLLKFESGNSYVYEGVEDNVLSDWIIAQSLGTYYNTYIKNNYVSKKVI